MGSTNTTFPIYLSLYTLWTQTVLCNIGIADIACCAAPIPAWGFRFFLQSWTLLKKISTKSAWLITNFAILPLKNAGRGGTVRDIIQWRFKVHYVILKVKLLRNVWLFHFFTLSKTGTFFTIAVYWQNKCKHQGYRMGSGLGRIRIILPDPDPDRYQFQANYKSWYFFLESLNRLSKKPKIITSLTLKSKIKHCKLEILWLIIK